MSNDPNTVVVPVAPKANWDALNPKIQFEGRAITLPSDPERMPVRKAIDALTRMMKDEEQPFTVREVIDAYPHDGAVAFVKAVAKLYGWASPQSTWTFGHPQMLAVKIGLSDDDVVQVPLGSFELPGIDGADLGTMFDNVNGKPVFVIVGTVKKKYRQIILELANETRRFVREESIYRGKAIRLGVEDDGDLNYDNPPTFMDVRSTTEDDLLFDGSIKEQITTNLLTPIRATARCRSLGIPLKRGILLEGPYGTGKSLTARMTAAVCEENGWTFILLDKVQGLHAALEFANRYAPAVVFAEDIDRIATERDEDMNDLINTIDGVVSKTAEIMTVLTTNFAEKLNPVILRPGRLDAVISLRAPGAETAERLVRHYSAGLIHEETDLTEVGAALAGQIPASIRECVERAKLGMIGRGDRFLLKQDLIVAADTMKNHLALLNGEKAKESDGDKLAKSLKSVLINGGEDRLKRVENELRDANSTIDQVDQNVRKVLRNI
jgi:hypothetical protein